MLEDEKKISSRFKDKIRNALNTSRGWHTRKKSIGNILYKIFRFCSNTDLYIFIHA